MRVKEWSFLTKDEGRMVADAITKRGYDCVFNLALRPWITGISFIAQRKPEIITLTITSWGETIEDQVEFAISEFEQNRDRIVRQFYEDRAIAQNKINARENILKLLEPRLMD